MRVEDGGSVFEPTETRSPSDCFTSRFEFSADLQLKLQSPAEVVRVFDEVRMQGDKGAVTTVDLPAGNVISPAEKYSKKL